METKFIDTHCHLDFPDFDKDRNEVIKRAYEGGVGKIINIGCEPKGIQKSLKIGEKYDFIFSSAGLHPQEADLGDEKFFSELEDILKEPKIVAIGECGLEFGKDSLSGFHGRFLPSIEKQKEIFTRQLDLARKFDKPVIIHCRNAYDDVLEILKEEKKKNPDLKGVMHFFTGRLSQAKKLFDLGFLISFTGVITFARDYDNVIKSAPLERIMIETDAPFVAPVPYRGKRNEPFYVKYVAEKIAELKGWSFEEVALATTKNAEKLFGI